MIRAILDKYSSSIFRSYVVLLILLAVLPLNSQQNVTLNHTYVVHIRLDHALHGIVFLPWIVLATRSVTPSILAALVSGILMAAFTEGIQFFLTYRSFNINDMIYNFSGVLIGSSLLLIPDFKNRKS